MENVMMNSMQTQIKIVDFGLSNAYNPNSPLRTHCGSPEYAAPELFVPGKSYGPEVDLWSLGVILFGMVAGQLPFVVAHEETMASQERRKKLLVQINKGYSNSQRKILSLASAEFRAMIARMLVADTLKRITVNELLFDGWVTEKGRKAIVTNPLRKLADEWQISIMKQVSNMLELDVNSVQHARAAEPQGDVAGVYNILAYKIQDKQLEGDCVTKTLQSQRIAERKANPESLSSKLPVKKRSERVKSPSLHKIQKVSIETTPRTAPVKRVLPAVEKRPQTSTAYAMRTRKPKDTPRIDPMTQPNRVKDSKSAYSTDARTRVPSAAERHIRQQINFLKEQFMTSPLEASNRIASASLPKPRISVSATQHRPLPQSSAKPRIQQATSAVRPVSPLRSTNTPRIRSVYTQNEVKVVGSQGIAKVLKKPAVKKENKASLKSSNSNVEAVLYDRFRNKSELAATINKHVAMSPANLVHRLTKANRVVPVMGNQSDSKVATATPSKNQQSRGRRPTTARQEPKLELVERSPLAQGDFIKRRASSTVATKRAPVQRAVLSDPIAKSIAGYLAKTIPTKPEVRKFKKTQPKPTSAV